MSHITTSTNTMSEILSQEMSYLMWYVSRFLFLLFFMLTQSWKMLLLTWMGLPLCWIIAKVTGNFQEVELFHDFPYSPQSQECLVGTFLIVLLEFDQLQLLFSFRITIVNSG